MDRLWTPWRYTYLSAAEPANACIFCAKPGEGDDERNFIVHRARFCFVLLNLYPYTSGHLMIAPYMHVATLDETPDEVLGELISMSG
jgi:ATP adenylyltransferase